eukprot:RCo044919
MTTSSQARALAVDLKRDGNAAHQNGHFRQAIFLFSKALDLCVGPDVDYVLFSNRSASYCLLGDYERALEDAEMVINLRPDWPKGFSRKAAALHGLGRFSEAIACFTTGLALDPSNEAAQRGLAD